MARSAIERAFAPLSRTDVLGMRGGNWIAALVPLGVIVLNWALRLWPLVAVEQKPSWMVFSLLTGPVQVSALVGALAAFRR